MNKDKTDFFPNNKNLLIRSQFYFKNTHEQRET
jgi:hypothetical protein